ncbi:MAG: DNA cytosine methyltransferase [[Ruminococcus] torques]
MRKYKMIDLFAGCGGLEDGFLQTGNYEDIAAVEWLRPQVNTLINRLETKWGISDAKERVMHFDIQREKELFEGWNDSEFGKSKGLDYYVNQVGGIDIIIGGPPCQAYSVAGRVRDENGMKDDYRNYLFEHYLSVVDRYRPKVFVFENVPGILSAAPDGTPITSLITKSFEKIGYTIIENLKEAKINASDYSVPQNRERIIIVGIDHRRIKNPEKYLDVFYKELLPMQKGTQKITVKEAIGDLPKCKPYFDEEHHKKKKIT